jgi:hypothetical protein
MRYLGYTIGDADAPVPMPTPEAMAVMGAFMEEAMTAGILVATGGLTPASEGITVRLVDGEFTVTDGPYAGANELVGGWALVEVTSREEAIEWTKRFLAAAGGGESRLRRVIGPEDFDPTAG